jgi:hypothetical protein
MESKSNGATFTSISDRIDAKRAEKKAVSFCTTLHGRICVLMSSPLQGTKRPTKGQDAPSKKPETKQVKAMNPLAAIFSAAKLSSAAAKKYTKLLESDGYCDAESLLCLDDDILMEDYKMKKDEAARILKAVSEA